jgi:hypothetical protein
MRLPRVQFTIPHMSIISAIVAVLLGGGQWAYDRYGGQTSVIAYWVGDLITPTGQTGVTAPVAELSKLATLLKQGDCTLSHGPISTFSR